MASESSHLTLGGYRGKRPRCNFYQRYGHTEAECRPKAILQNHLMKFQFQLMPIMSFSNTRQPPQPIQHVVVVAQFANLVACISKSSFGPWILDLGASDHMSSNKSFFSQLTYFDSLASVTMVNGSQIRVHGIGHTCPSSNLTPDYVLYILGCPFNLISISKLTRTQNYSILFPNNFVLVQDRRTRQTIGAEHESRGLYYLSQSVACISTAFQALKHQCLGHRNPTKMCLTLPSLSHSSSFQCESCQFGKHTHHTYGTRVNKSALSPFALVHYIWGPSRVCSTLGFYYFVTFIDDFSRCTWLFLMKNCSNVFSIFQGFWT